MPEEAHRLFRHKRNDLLAKFFGWQYNSEILETRSIKMNEKNETPVSRSYDGNDEPNPFLYETDEEYKKAFYEWLVRGIEAINKVNEEADRLIQVKMDGT